MPTSPEQIAASIAASHARKAAARKVAAAKVVPPPHKFADVDGKLIGFVVKTRHEKFKPFIGKVIVMEEDPSDALVHVVGEQPPQDSLPEALAFYAPDKNAFAMVLEQPVPSGGMMGHWLGHMLSFQNRVVETGQTPYPIMSRDQGF
jgi:hypothetical protein